MSSPESALGTITRSGSSRIVAADPGAGECHDVGRRAAEDDRHPGDLGELDRGVAGVVAGRVVLLVRRLVLLVDDDHAEPRQGGEDGRARADDDARLAVARPPPLVEALAHAERAVQERDLAGEASGEALDRLRRQRDLRDEHDRLLPSGEHVGDQPKVDLGLAARGDAVEEEHARAAERFPKRREDAFLGGREHRGRQRGDVAPGERVAPDLALAEHDQPALRQRRDDGPAPERLR